MTDSTTLSKSRKKPVSTPRVRTTLKAVAEQAGVSKGLASRVLNGGSTTIPISEETIRRVRQAATDLRYIPSRMARSLSKGARSHIIGLSLVAPLPLNGAPAPVRESNPVLPKCYQNPFINEVLRIQQCHDVGSLINDVAQDEQMCGRWDVVVRHRKEHLDHPFTRWISVWIWWRGYSTRSPRHVIWRFSIWRVLEYRWCCWVMSSMVRISARWESTTIVPVNTLRATCSNRGGSIWLGCGLSIRPPCWRNYGVRDSTPPWMLRVWNQRKNALSGCGPTGPVVIGG